MKYVLCLVVLYSGFEMSERVEGDVVDSWVAKFLSNPLALSLKDPPLVPYASRKHLFRLCIILKFTEHSLQFVGCLEHSGVAPFLRSHSDRSVLKVDISPLELADLAYSHARLSEQLKKRGELP